MTTKLLSTYKQKIKEMKLIPSSGGCFELKVGNELLYSKLKTGTFPNEGDLVQAVGGILK